MRNIFFVLFFILIGVWANIEVRESLKATDYYIVSTHYIIHQLKNSGCEHLSTESEGK